MRKPRKSKAEFRHGGKETRMPKETTTTSTGKTMPKSSEISDRDLLDPGRMTPGSNKVKWG